MAKWIDIPDAADLDNGQRRCANIDGKQIVIAKVDDAVCAFEDECPHAGLPLGEGELAGRVITCPYHGYAFDIKTGRNIDYADDPGLTCYAVRIENGNVQVDLDPTDPSGDATHDQH